ncbi:MAG: hypothetical protein KC435_01495 [Thermomicrobiales bacterium]|nr:hypothetical protein [Thermomicrobiales bacterium]
MRFGTVQGVLGESEKGRWFTVILTIRDDNVVVRDDLVPQALASEEASWLIDQLVQETLGNELAEQGWEVIAVGDEASSSETQSRIYTVRNLGE